jgi:hypothetical protein
MRPLATFAALAVVTFVFPSAVLADEGATLDIFEGGELTAGGYVSLGFLYGAGSRPDALGTPVSTVRSHVASVTGNPAGLAYLETGGVLIDVLPALSASITDYVDIDGQAEDMIDDALEGMASPTLTPVYPSIQATAGQQGRLVAGVAAFRLGPVVAGASLEEPVSISFGMVSTGVEGFAESVKDTGGTQIEIELRAMADAAADLSFEMRRTSFAAGGNVTPSIAFGASVQRYTGAASAVGVVRMDGTVSYAGQEFTFNDPSDPWHNDLGYSANGSYSGDATGWTAGLSWRATDWITVDAAYVKGPELTLSGELVTEENTLEAFSDDGLELGELSPTQPTLTAGEVTIEHDSVAFQLPSYLGATASFRTGFLLTTLEYRRYSNGLTFSYDNETRGVDLSDGVGVMLDAGIFRIGGGVVRATTVGTSEDHEPEEMLLPMANVGIGFGIGDSLRLDSSILSASTEVLRISASYEF